MFYFAYGSNMSTHRLQRRVPSARAVGAATLMNHAFRWNVKGGDGSAKANIEKVNSEKYVLGVLFSILPEEQHFLDTAEGLGSRYYREDSIEVLTSDGVRHTAFTYYALKLTENILPFDWYKNFLLTGASQHNLDASYIEMLSSFPSTIDSNLERRAMNVAITEEPTQHDD